MSYNQPKKFAIIGTSCAGKTALTHALVGRLKSYGVLADGVYSQDRKFSFPIEAIDSEPAQNWMIANLIAKEADLGLHTDVEVLISDRSPLDLMAYYTYQFTTELSKAALAYVVSWCKTYDALYYLDPLPYQDDTKRPDDAFRMDVDRVLLQLMAEAQEQGVNIKRVARKDILLDLMQKAGLKKPTVKQMLQGDDVQRLANFLRTEIRAKFPRTDDALSDTDMWVLLGAPGHSVTPETYLTKAQSLRMVAKQWLAEHCGPWVQFDVNCVTTFAGLEDLNLLQFHPQPI